MPFGVVDAARFAGRQAKRKPSWAPPDHLLWRIGKFKARRLQIPHGYPYHGPSLPPDNPFTHLNSAEYSGYRPYKGWDPRPTTADEWRDVVRDIRYTRYYPKWAMRRAFGTKVTAGLETKPVDDQEEERLTSPKYDITKPLQLQLKQRRMAKTAWAEKKGGGTEKEASLWHGKDPFLHPNRIAIDYNDRSVHSAQARKEAMSVWRALSPDKHFRVAKDRLLSVKAHLRGLVGNSALGGFGPRTSRALLPLEGEALKAWLAENSPEGPTVDFDTFLKLYTLGSSTYYKLAGMNVPGNMEMTGSTAFPLGLSHTGISAYESTGAWSHG